MDSEQKVLSTEQHVTSLLTIIRNKEVRLRRIYHMISTSYSPCLIPLGPTDMAQFGGAFFLS